MRISDWSSDVCSSDLQAATLAKAREEAQGIVGAATARMQEESAARLAVLDEDLGKRISEAEAQIASAASAASAELDKLAAAAAADIVARLTGQQAGEDAPLPEAADRKSTRLKSSHYCAYRMPTSA